MKNSSSSPSSDGARSTGFSTRKSSRLSREYDYLPAPILRLCPGFEGRLEPYFDPGVTFENSRVLTTRERIEKMSRESVLKILKELRGLVPTDETK
jgi:hypothetical protein